MVGRRLCAARTAAGAPTLDHHRGVALGRRRQQPLLLLVLWACLTSRCASATLSTQRTDAQGDEEDNAQFAAEEVQHDGAVYVEPPDMQPPDVVVINQHADAVAGGPPNGGQAAQMADLQALSALAPQPLRPQGSVDWGSVARMAQEFHEPERVGNVAWQLLQRQLGRGADEGATPLLASNGTPQTPPSS